MVNISSLFLCDFLVTHCLLLWLVVMIKELEEKLYIATKENVTLEEDLQEKTKQVYRHVK